MLPDSMNVGVIAENIKKLEAMVQEAGAELPTPEAGDAGKVLTVNNELGYSIAAVPHEVPTPGEGDTGKIIKVGASGYELATEYSYTPPSYSSTAEVNTGRKWIDGRDVYEKTFIGKTPTESYSSLSLGAGSEIIHLYGTHSATNSRTYDFGIGFNTSYYDEASGYYYVVTSTTAAYQDVDYKLVFLYVKPAPVPSNETRKTTKKK